MGDVQKARQWFQSLSHQELRNEESKNVTGMISGGLSIGYGLAMGLVKLVTWLDVRKIPPKSHECTK